MRKTEERKRVNFMISKRILVKMEELIPPGKRSDFVNESLEGAMVNFARKKAAKAMDEIAGSNKLRMTTEEFIKLKNYGRP